MSRDTSHPISFITFLLSAVLVLGGALITSLPHQEERSETSILFDVSLKTAK